MDSYTVALAGNPNVGKSTVFNALTGLRQHTGNWCGKTVSAAEGRYMWEGASFRAVDLPGTYSLHPDSPEEEVTRACLAGGADVTVAVLDASCLRRNLRLLVQLRCRTGRLVVCLNMMDEARRRGAVPDSAALSAALGVPVVETSARDRTGLDALRRAAASVARCSQPPPPWQGSDDPLWIAQRADALADGCLGSAAANRDRDRRLDRLLTGKYTALPLMLALLGAVFALTLWGANLPSALLSRGLMALQEPLRRLLSFAPWWVQGALVDGVYRTAAWVVAVMLPPMAIFFPLFTLLEDAGLLPRFAFNCDALFRRAGGSGRQCLTMCMGLGCNACGVMGCRIIDSPRERLAAILTNVFVPCNGRLPALMVMAALLCGGGRPLLSAGAFLGCILLALAITLGATRLLTATVLRGKPSAFTLELPPYRTPRVGQVLLRSLLDRTLFVLGRAVTVSVPAGLLLWLLVNLQMGGQPLLYRAAALLHPLGELMGLDGMTLTALLVGFPANEIVLPSLAMGYLHTGALTDCSADALRSLLAANGWTAQTALCMMLLCLCHFPCGTTCLTIRRETGSLRWTLLAILLPSAVGVALCTACHGLCRLL